MTSDWKRIAEQQSETIEALAGLCGNMVRLLAMHTDVSREEQELQRIMEGAHD